MPDVVVKQSAQFADWLTQDCCRKLCYMVTLKLALKYLMSVLFVFAGVYHFVNPDFYLRIMPPYLPWHLFLVYLSGVFEIVFGILLSIPRFTRVAGFGLVALLIAIFPANIHMATHAELYPDIKPIALWIRLPLQGVMIAWAYWYTRHGSAGVSPAPREAKRTDADKH